MEFSEMKCPKGIRRKAWDILWQSGMVRCRRLSGIIPAFAVDAMREKRVIALGNPAVQQVLVVTAASGYSVYQVYKDKDFFSYLDEDVRLRLAAIQKDIYLHPVFQGLWSRNTQNMTSAQFKAQYDDFDEETVKGFNGQYRSEQGVIGGIVDAYRVFVKHRAMREVILFSGKAIIPALLAKFGAKIERAYKRGGTYHVLTKPLSVVIDRVAGKELGLGRYAVSVVEQNNSVLGYRIARRDGPLRVAGGVYYLSAYIRVGRRRSRSVTNHSEGVCFGSNGDIVKAAIAIGDVYTVFDSILQLIDQPNYLSQGPFVQWIDIAREMKPEWPWCPSCFLLTCTCVMCFCRGAPGHTTADICKLCGYCANQCLCVECEICSQGRARSGAVVSVVLDTIGSDGRILQQSKDVALCLEHATEENMGLIRAVYARGGLRDVESFLTQMRMRGAGGVVLPNQSGDVPADIEAMLSSLSGQSVAASNVAGLTPEQREILRRQFDSLDESSYDYYDNELTPEQREILRRGADNDAEGDEAGHG